MYYRIMIHRCAISRLLDMMIPDPDLARGGTAARDGLIACTNEVFERQDGCGRCGIFSGRPGRAVQDDPEIQRVGTSLEHSNPIVLVDQRCLQVQPVQQGCWSGRQKALRCVRPLFSLTTFGCILMLCLAPLNTNVSFMKCMEIMQLLGYVFVHMEMRQ